MCPVLTGAETLCRREITDTQGFVLLHPEFSSALVSVACKGVSWWFLCLFFNPAVALQTTWIYTEYLSPNLFKCSSAEHTDSEVSVEAVWIYQQLNYQLSVIETSPWWRVQQVLQSTNVIIWSQRCAQALPPSTLLSLLGLGLRANFIFTSFSTWKK